MKLRLLFTLTVSPMVISAIALVVLVIAPLGAIPANRDGLASALEQRDAIHSYTVAVEKDTFRALIGVTEGDDLTPSTAELARWQGSLQTQGIPHFHGPIYEEAAQAHRLLLIAVGERDPQSVAPAFGAALDSAGLGLQASNELIDLQMTRISAAAPAFTMLAPDLDSARSHLVADRIVARHARALGQIGVEIAVSDGREQARTVLALLEAERTATTLSQAQPEGAAHALNLSRMALDDARALLASSDLGPEGLAAIWPNLEDALEALEEIRRGEARALATDLANVSAQAATAAWIAGGAVVFLAASAPVAVWTLRRRVLRPILDLHEATEATPAEETRQLEAAAHDDEIGDLTRSFGQMTRRITEANRQLRAALAEATDRRDALAESVARLSDADRLRQHILNTASHELRTPLTPMRIHLKLLDGEKQGPLTDGQRRSIRSISSNLDRLLGVITEMALMHDLQTGKLGVNAIETDVAAVVRSAAADAQAAMTAAEITLDCIADEPVTALADEARLRQVIDILLENARLYTAAGGHVTIRVQDHHIEVSDDGRGMTPDDLARIFTPFERGDTGAAPEAAGLGLSIARSLMELMQGTISGESPGPGLGSTFRLTLRPPSL